MRVTDLDEFTNTHIVLPYKPEMPSTVAIKNPDDAYRALTDHRYTQWAQYVINRLNLIGVTFPRYITHPLVTLIEHEANLYRERNREAQKDLRPSLADLSAQQRLECVGMWVEYIPGILAEGDVRLGVLVYCEDSYAEAAVLRPDFASDMYWAQFKIVYPLYDLPRAWTPSGHPAGQEQEHQEC